MLKHMFSKLFPIPTSLHPPTTLQSNDFKMSNTLNSFYRPTLRNQHFCVCTNSYVSNFAAVHRVLLFMKHGSGPVKTSEFQISSLWFSLNLMKFGSGLILLNLVKSFFYQIQYTESFVQVRKCGMQRFEEVGQKHCFAKFLTPPTLTSWRIRISSKK